MSTPDNKPENKNEDRVENISDNSTEQPTETTEKTEPTATNKKPSVPLWANILIYISTIVFPLIGIAMGFTYFRKEDPEMRRAGRNWLILGVVVLLINIALVSTIKKAESGL